MAETTTDSLPDDVRNSLHEAVNSALVSAVPYVLAKDLRQDYPTVKFDILLTTIKQLIIGGIDNEAAIMSRRTLCIIIRRDQALDLDLRDCLHTNVKR